MRRVAILTIDGQSNYGNRLQNFALQETLRSLGFQVETLRNSPEPRRGWSRDRIIDAARKVVGTAPPELVRTVRSRLASKSSSEGVGSAVAQRVAGFAAFEAANVSHSAEFTLDRSTDRRSISAVSDAYDAFVVGSDQIWNPFQRHGTPHDFLRFAPVEKRTAYAASFGVDAVPRRYRDRYARWLMDIPNISVREEKGAALVKELTGRDALVVVDPTLLLSASDWSRVATPARSKPASPYLLTYFLGEVSPARRELLGHFARQQGLTVVNLNSLEDLPAYAADPAEFVDYIASASYVFTDSFHGAVFSILFHRRFMVFGREGDGPSMSSRLESLLSRFGLDGQMYSGEEDFEESPDYSMVEAVLDEQRESALAFLRASLGANGGTT